MKPQVEKLIVGTGVSTQTTLKTFLASATDGQVKILSATGGVPAVGKDFKVYQKTGDSFEFSDLIKADKVERVKVVTYKPEVQKKVTVSGFTGNVQANSTYAVEVRLYNEGGSLSVENFAVISGYYVTGANITNETATTVRDGVLDSLNANLKLRGANEVLAVAAGADITIEGRVQKVVPGKIEGRQIQFDVTGKVYDNVSLLDENLGLLTTVVTTKANPGQGTGKYAVNLEWFTKGFDNEVYRGTSYPVGFDTPYYTKIGSFYNVIHIFFYDGRDYTSVERQHKLLTILMDKGANTAANNAATNTMLAALRTILGTDKVPAALAVV